MKFHPIQFKSKQLMQQVFLFADFVTFSKGQGLWKWYTMAEVKSSYKPGRYDTVWNTLLIMSSPNILPRKWKDVHSWSLKSRDPKRSMYSSLNLMRLLYSSLSLMRLFIYSVLVTHIGSDIHDIASRATSVGCIHGLKIQRLGNHHQRVVAASQTKSATRLELKQAHMRVSFALWPQPEDKATESMHSIKWYRPMLPKPAARIEKHLSGHLFSNVHCERTIWYPVSDWIVSRSHLASLSVTVNYAIKIWISSAL